MRPWKNCIWQWFVKWALWIVGTFYILIEKLRDYPNEERDNILGLHIDEDLRDKTRFELTPEGNLDSLWYQLERDRTINPEGKSALEIYKAWGPANGVDDLEDPVDWSESAKVLEKNNISVEEVKPILNNQNALNRKIDENSVGAVSTGTIVNSITNTLGSSHKHSITSRRGFTEKWNGELVPAAMRLAVTHKLPNGAIIPIAMAMYFQKHNLITEDGQVLVYNDPQIKRILASIKNGGLD